ncbi:hypothetical protein [Campylobacter portucalensis]|uniref:hypothetical protein n=1 Tax=Campylobacter portucalensis TaxID=2608384 RepID=UPI0012B29C39|nr:hypothetical protein [Campylobacter portucalensis]
MFSIFINPGNIFEILPFFWKPFKDIPLLEILRANPIYPENIVFYVCLMSIISIISISGIAYNHFYYRVYEFGMFNISKSRWNLIKNKKNTKKLDTILSVFVLMSLLIGYMIYGLYFYNDSLASGLFHINISNLF